MNFAEAFEKLGQLAPGKYRSATYKLTEDQFGNKKQECSLYIDCYNIVTDGSWSGALEKMENKLTDKLMGADIPPETVEELPHVENP